MVPTGHTSAHGGLRAEQRRFPGELLLQSARVIVSHTAAVPRSILPICSAETSIKAWNPGRGDGVQGADHAR